MKLRITKELKSIAITFIATFVLTVLYGLQQDPNFNYFDQSAVLALIVAGTRTAVKVVVDDLIPLVGKVLKKK